MKERPILFSGPMVRAILDGRKTQTRRIVKLPLKDPATGCEIAGCEVNSVLRDTPELCPYGQPCDRLWVRETFIYGGKNLHDDGTPWVFLAYAENPKTSVLHPAREDYDKIMASNNDPYISWADLKKTPAIFMRRWMSRITLEVTAIRVERLQDISEEDALAEGLTEWQGMWGWPEDTQARWSRDPVAAYRCLWESINGSGSWDANPWVWVVEFRRVEE